MKRVFTAFAAALVAAGCNSGEIIVSGGGGGAETSAEFESVIEFRPAPGQFINDPYGSGYTGQETTEAAALAYAERRLRSGMYVSLGGFGGYIVVGFDHRVANGAGGDLLIGSNQTMTSNEPGIVWVMRDDNGNGLPDDVWYELAGSDSGSDFAEHGTLRNYSVTYHRPTSAGGAVTWTDNAGGSGTLERNKYHQQEGYFPAWIADESYTLVGTRLEARNYDDGKDGEEYWINPPYDWGYVDNMGSDMLPEDTSLPLPSGVRFVAFDISNAIGADGTRVNLDGIDFVKVQSAVNAVSGSIGENSTEVMAVYDYHKLVGTY